MATKKFESYYEVFDPMANFAAKNGMTSYQSDIMHDAVQICKMAESKTEYEMVFAVRSNGCGTDFWELDKFEMLEKNGCFDPNRPKAIVKYDGEFFYFITED